MQGITTFFVFSSCVGSALQKYLTFNHVYNIYKYLQYIQIPAIYTNIYNIQGVSKKTSFCQNWRWQILLLTVRNPYETFANTSKTPSPSLTTSKCVSTCDEFVPNCFVVFQAGCCILLPKIVIPEQGCLQGRNSVSLSDPFLQWSSTGGGVPKTFCLGSW